jgi:cellobiose-specific phosphotransferase system component IIC
VAPRTGFRQFAGSAFGAFPTITALPVQSGSFVVLGVLMVLVHEVMLWWLGAHGATPFLLDRDMDSIVHVLTIVNVISLRIGMSRATERKFLEGR